eukprot:GHVH01004619.1.p1 GENE.GHVH01004619.1~~GHVH01004619.1.p1  ORF type:complete len:251 (+),score=38.32 GHVH01004619.1:32-784(+)
MTDHFSPSTGVPVPTEECFFTLNRHLRDQSSVLGREHEFASISTSVAPVKLDHSWVLWEQVVPQHNRSYGAKYECNLKEIAKFNCIQEFWCLWDHLPQPSELMMNKKMISDGPETRQIVDAIMIFKEGIRPMWEDDRNQSGGLFEYKFRPNMQGISHAHIDEFWNNLVVAIVGGCIDPHGMITGVRLVDKLSSKGAGFLRMEVWFSNFADETNRFNLKNAVETAISTRLDGTFHTVLEGDTKEHKKQHGR